VGVREKLPQKTLDNIKCFGWAVALKVAALFYYISKDKSKNRMIIDS